MIELRDEYYPDKDYSTLSSIKVGIKMSNAVEINSSQEAGHGIYAKLAFTSEFNRKIKYNNAASLGDRKST